MNKATFKNIQNSTDRNERNNEITKRYKSPKLNIKV